MSDAETQFYFQVKAAGLPLPEREYRFAQSIGRQWRFDFCWPDRMLAVEVEGGVYSGGRHVRGDGYSKDLEKYNQAVLMGYKLLRYTPGMIGSGEALADVEQALSVAMGID